MQLKQNALTLTRIWIR